MRLLPKSVHRCRRYPTKFNSGRDIPEIGDSLEKPEPTVEGEPDPEDPDSARHELDGLPVEIARYPGKIGKYELDEVRHVKAQVSRSRPFR